MSDEPDLVSLLYRADWTRLSLAAEVSASRDRDLWRSRFGDDAPPGAPGRGTEPRATGPGGPWGPRGPWGPLGLWGPWRPRAARARGPWGPWVPWDEAPDIADEPEEDAAPRRRFFGGPGVFGGPGAGHEWEMATDQLSTQAGRSTLLVMPGRRYRWQREDLLSGCDGERSWSAVRDGDGWETDADGDPDPPLGLMLQPSWLLSGFALEYGGPVTASGRDALRVVATPRPDLWPRTFLRLRPLDRVELAVDAGLGILLRHEEILDGRTLSVTRLTDVRVDPPAPDDALFLPPGGWESVRDEAPEAESGGPAWEVAKLVGGLAAGGLGAWIGSRRFQPFEQATQEEPEAEMPVTDGPPPADGPPASATVLHLVHASRDGWAPGITATLHQWHDVAAMLAQVPDSARRAGFGGLGLLVDTLGERMATLHTVLRLSADGSGRYRIELALPPELARRSSRHRATTIVCDGERRWEIFEDHAAAGPAKPPASEFAELLDASWLLEHRLSGGEEVAVGGRRGYRFAVTPAEPVWGGMFFTDDVVVDAELGILLRAACHAGSTPVSRYELRDVVLGEPAPGTFAADIPDGLRVDEEPDRSSGPVNIPVKVASRLARKAAEDARSAVRNVLGVLRGEDRH